MGSIKLKLQLPFEKRAMQADKRDASAMWSEETSQTFLDFGRYIKFGCRLIAYFQSASS